MGMTPGMTGVRYNQDTGALEAWDAASGAYVGVGDIKTVTIGNQAGTFPAALSVPTATSAVLTYYPILFGGIQDNDAGATISGVDGAYSGIIVPAGFSYIRCTSLVAASDAANTTGAGWYAVRLRSVSGRGTFNISNTRVKALAPDAFSTPSTNVQTTSPWIPIGGTVNVPAGVLIDVGDKIEAAIWQNSGLALSFPLDQQSTWLMCEFK